MKAILILILICVSSSVFGQTKVFVSKTSCGSSVTFKFIFDDVKYIQLYQFGKLIKVVEIYGPETRMFQFAEWSRTPFVFICEDKDSLRVYFESSQIIYECNGNQIKPKLEPI